MRPKLPRSLEEKSRTTRLGPDVPTLLAHPDWDTPVPAVLWMHGRTACKELDPGRYQRWLRAGIATVAVDLPGHGERYDEALQGPERTLDNFRRMVDEIDPVLDDALDRMPIDPDRIAIGGMSAGGMATLIRLTRPGLASGRFAGAAIESTTGDLEALYFGDPEIPDTRPWPATHDRDQVAALSPMGRLDELEPVPLLSIHTVGDAVVPWAIQRRFLDRLRERYAEAGADPGLIEVQTYEDTGAPDEHAGFGREGANAKDRQTEFLSRVLRAETV
ncbi:MAG: alpha/beta hydrolase family protein [Phycisphaerales bacterium JB040]